MKKNRLFRLTDKEIEVAAEAIISVKHGLTGHEEATLQRVLDKMFISQWYSDTQIFSEKERQSKLLP